MKARISKEDPAFTGILEIIGSKLLELRVKKGYSSHVDFAAEHKLPRIQYWRMEKGKTNATLKSLNKVLSIHDLSIQDLFIKIQEDAKNKLIK